MEQENKIKLLDILKNDLDIVTTWLSFAEAKNAMLIAFNIALIGAYEWLKKAFVFSLNINIFIGLVIVSIFIALVSFFPNLNKIQTLKKIFNKNTNKDNEPLNMLFFKDIAKINTGANLIERINKEYLTDRIDNKKLEEDMADELVENSKIAVLKYDLFKIALSIDLFVVFYFAIGILLCEK